MEFIKNIFNSRKKVLIGLIILILVLIRYGIYNAIPKHNVFVKASGMHYKRDTVNAIKLNDGTVLVFGTNERVPNKTAEIYYPDKNKYEVLPNEMNRERRRATATLLNDGRVLIVGGERCVEKPMPPTAEIYDPNIKKFILINGVHYDRFSHAASLLNDGKVLITGGNSLKYQRGLSASHEELSNAEIFDPKTNKFSLLKLPRPMFDHLQTTLNDGRVLIVAGDNRWFTGREELRDDIHAFIFDSKTNKFISIKPTKYKHDNGAAILLNDGRVLVAGGYDLNPIIFTEIFDPKTNKFSMGSKMNNPRAMFSATLLQNGNVLVAGGASGYGTTAKRLERADIFDIKQNKFITQEFFMHKKRLNHVAVLLDNGNVLIPDYEFSEIFLK